MTRDTIIRSRGRKAGFVAKGFRHRCTGSYAELCRKCKQAIRRGDSSTLRATKRIEWLKAEYRVETDRSKREGILQTALLYMRERVAGTHSDFQTIRF